MNLSNPHSVSLAKNYLTSFDKYFFSKQIPVKVLKRYNDFEMCYLPADGQNTAEYLINHKLLKLIKKTWLLNICLHSEQIPSVSISPKSLFGIGNKMHYEGYIIAAAGHEVRHRLQLEKKIGLHTLENIPEKYKGVLEMIGYIFDPKKGYMKNIYSNEQIPFEIDAVFIQYLISQELNKNGYKEETVREIICTNF